MMSQAENAASRVLETYAAAVFAKDLNAFVALYATDVHVFDAWGVRSYEGIDAWRAVTADWFASLGAERVMVDFEDERIRVEAGLAYASAIVRFTAISAAGQTLRSLQNRMTIVLRHAGGDWSIVHQHTSCPFDFHTKKAALELGPVR